MARRRATSQSTLVGIAVAVPGLRRSIVGALIASSRFEAVAFAAADLKSGKWPRRRFAAVVATPQAFHARLRTGIRSRIPVIVVVRDAHLTRQKTVLDQADAFVLVDRLELLPSAIILAGEGLSIVPRRPIATKKK